MDYNNINNINNINNLSNINNINNICKFVSGTNGVPTEINTINFVLENTRVQENERIRSVYAVHLVMRGTGKFICDKKEYDIGKGDIFFTLPSSLYAVRSVRELEYAYVSFLGLGAPALLKRVMPDDIMRVFSGNEGLIPFWKGGIERANPENIDLISKSVLEYSAASLIVCRPAENTGEAVAKIEKFVRLHFTDSELSLKWLAEKFGYNEKYLSKLFFRHTGVRFGEYLTSLRINAACGLLRDGKTSVKEAAIACGFSDPLYFSKVFKSRMGVSPSEFVGKMPQ